MKVVQFPSGDGVDVVAGLRELADKLEEGKVFPYLKFVAAIVMEHNSDDNFWAWTPVAFGRCLPLEVTGAFTLGTQHQLVLPGMDYDG